MLNAAQQQYKRTCGSYIICTHTQLLIASLQDASIIKTYKSPGNQHHHVTHILLVIVIFKCHHSREMRLRSLSVDATVTEAAGPNETIDATFDRPL